MLDGRVEEKKEYRARKIIDAGDGKAAAITMHFTAINDEEAKRFLEAEEYKGYKLISNDE